jgi:hypothetical protein
MKKGFSDFEVNSAIPSRRTSALAGRRIPQSAIEEWRRNKYEEIIIILYVVGARQLALFCPWSRKGGRCS